jgi:hypothetical protein
MRNGVRKKIVKCGRCEAVGKFMEKVDVNYYLCAECAVRLRDLYVRKGADFWSCELKDLR